MRHARFAALAALAVLGATACMQSRGTEPAGGAAQSTAPATKPGSEEERQREIAKRSELRGERPAADAAGGAQPEPPTEAVAGEVPDAILNQMKADLATRVGKSADGARVLRAEQVVWPDGSIGCAKPGVLYTQQSVPGYLVDLEFEGKRYRYHAPLAGGATYCERPGPFLERLGPAQ